MKRQPHGITLIEVLVVLAIISILIGLLLPAIAKVRAAARRLSSMNNLRQCALAVQHLSDARGVLPGLDGTNSTSGLPLMGEMLPYVEEENFYRQGVEAKTFTTAYTVRLYLSPADPTVDWSEKDANLASYAANAFAIPNECRLASHFSDGLSQTILFAEHYAWGCGGVQFGWGAARPSHYFFPDLGEIRVHRPTFAESTILLTDVGHPYHPVDIFPVTSGNPPVAAGSEPGLTFQTRPSMANCDPRLAQTPHDSGMLVAMFDGSVRTLAPNTTPALYWGMVTPRGGEVLGE
jgi:prepilin-type N-terminal cleavage/methylation domain-containing protein